MSPIIEGQWQPTADADLSAAIRQAVGTASMCWAYPAGAGTFDSEQALWVAQGLERWLRQHHYIGSP